MLTDGSKGDMTVADFYKSWNRLRGRLARNRKGGAYMNEYAAVVEVQERGALHLHVLMTGRYVPQRVVAEMAREAGFGRCTDIREVRPVARDGARGSAAYVTKQLTGYLTKQSATALSAKTNLRRRPLRTSRGWGGGMNMQRALRLLSQGWMEEAGKEPDEGPFAFVQLLPGGDLLVRVADGWERHQVMRAGAEHAQATSDDGAAEPPRGGAATQERGADAAQVPNCVATTGRAP